MDKRNAQVYAVLQPDQSRAVKFANSEKYPEAKGTLFKKRIINFGEYADQWFPEYTLVLDKEGWGQSVLDNFAASTVGRVYVPSSHTDDPDKNRGEVIDMFFSEDGKGIDGILDIRDLETVKKIEEDLIWDVSIGFTMNWVTKEGDEKGPAIYHVALVNNPYIEDMTPFEAFAKITEVCRAELASSHQASAIMLSRSGIKKEYKEFAMEKVTNDKDYEVKTTITVDGEEQELVIAAGAEVEVPADQKEAVETAIAESEAPEAEETEEEKAAREAKEAEEAAAEAAKSEEDKAKDAELARVKAENAEYRKKAVDAEYDRLLKEGKIVPAQEGAFKALAEARDSSVQFSNAKGKTVQKPVSELLTELFAHAPKVVKFSEDGGEGGEGAGAQGTGEDQTPYDKLSEEAKAGLQATNVSKERYNENVAKHPEMYPEHQSTNKKDEE